MLRTPRWTAPASGSCPPKQRSLVDELTKAAFEGADVTNPSAALREDITGTLQAAVADPDVTARLGRLIKAERWSGFGEFGDTTTIFTAARRSDKADAEPKPARRKPAEAQRRDDDRESARRLQKARAAVAAAERTKVDADNELSERQTDLAVARLRHDEMRQRLQEAERNLARPTRLTRRPSRPAGKPPNWSRKPRHSSSRPSARVSSADSGFRDGEIVCGQHQAGVRCEIGHGQVDPRFAEPSSNFAKRAGPVFYIQNQHLLLGGDPDSCTSAALRTPQSHPAPVCGPRLARRRS